MSRRANAAATAAPSPTASVRFAASATGLVRPLAVHGASYLSRRLVLFASLARRRVRGAAAARATPARDQRSRPAAACARSNLPACPKTRDGVPHPIRVDSAEAASWAFAAVAPTSMRIDPVSAPSSASLATVAADRLDWARAGATNEAATTTKRFIVGARGGARSLARFLGKMAPLPSLAKARGLAAG